jgi:hypothetical protein
MGGVPMNWLKYLPLAELLARLALTAVAQKKELSEAERRRRVDDALELLRRPR